MTDASLPTTTTAVDAGPDRCPQAPAKPVILDAQALDALSQIDPTGANRLVYRVMTTYRSSLARLLVQLAQARTLADPASLKLATHTLKSSSASVGALTLSTLCGEAEQALRDGRLDVVPALLDQLEAEAARVDAAVSQLLDDPSTTPR